MISAIREAARRDGRAIDSMNGSTGVVADGTKKKWKRRLVDGLRKGYRWSEDHIPPGLRLVTGLVLMAGGVFGFLPILGFWMIPLGAMLVAMDIPPLHRRLRRRLHPHAKDTAEPDS